MPTALCLCSGGYDSILAIALLQKANIKVIALNFVSHFFGGPSEKISEFAYRMSIPVIFVPFYQAQLRVTLDPKYGRGKNFNACIDCHALMIRYAGGLLERYGADFIATGEVLNQRPMSQNMKSLKNVADLSGFAGLLVRPLSGRLLPKTEAEEKGFISRADMRDIQGRSQKGQYKLARELGVAFVMQQGHAGGCILTDVYFANKLKAIHADGCLNESSFIPYCLQSGRFLRIAKGCYAFVGRNETENAKFAAVKRFGTFFEADADTPGPCALFVEMKSLPMYATLVKDIESDSLVCGECSWNHNGERFTLEGVVGHFPLGPDIMPVAFEIYSTFCKHKGQHGGFVFVDGVKIEFEAISSDRKDYIRDLIIQ